jgi:prepilin-type N-terminal cleavage/methylation domain-containing protein
MRRSSKQRLTGHAGFTLIELMVVVLIIAILLASNRMRGAVATFGRCRCAAGAAQGLALLPSCVAMKAKAGISDATTWWKMTANGTRLCDLRTVARLRLG